MQITSRRFDFPGLIEAHGWRHLAPFRWDAATGTLQRPLVTPRGRVDVAIRARTRDEKALVSVKAQPGEALQDADARAAVRGQVRRMLWLGTDFSAFHHACAGDSLLGFVANRRAGGLLRSPMAFEDVVKTVFTTNCSWNNTRLMCERLCSLFGGAFPSSREVLGLSEEELVREVRVGYRARTVLELARLEAEGDLPLDEWAAQGRFEEARAALRRVWGLGPYAVSHILVLLGDFSRIPVDCEVLRYLRVTHFQGQEVPAGQAVEPYERYGGHRYLAFKFGRIARRGR